MVGKERFIKRATDFSQRLAKEYKLRRIYLFGSLAGGLFLKNSDIDIAIEGMDFEDYLRALAEHRYLKGVHLDILHLDFCRPKLREAILKEGKVLYEKEQ